MTKMSRAEKRHLKMHASRNITYLLDRMGVRYIHRDKLVQAACPCSQHGGDGDNETAFSWRIDLGTWVCWSHACDETFGNDIFGLVRSVLQLNFYETVRWLDAAFKEKNIDVKGEVEDIVEKKESVLHVHQPLNEEKLRFLQQDPEYLLNRGFDKNVLREYEVGFWSRLGTYMHDCVVFPIRDHENYLVGYSGRTVLSEGWHNERNIKYAKWKHARHYDRFPVPGELFTGSILYNLNRAKDSLTSDRTIILVEGPLDGIKLEMAGIHNWVASLSTKFGIHHRTLLVRFGINKLYVAYDNDSPRGPKKERPGEKGWKRVQSVVGDLFDTERISLPVDVDLGSMSIPLIQETLKHVTA